jgi:hypothetical protein
MNDDISKEIDKILSDYSDKAVRVLEQAEKSAAQFTVRQLKATSPRKSGKYASGWTSKKEGSGKSGGYTVYNRKPGLTHLLEKGHVVANQHGRTGRRTSGQKHIQPAEQAGIEHFEREVVSKMEE